MGDQVYWERVEFTSKEMIYGRQCHSCISYNDRLIVFGGCFQFNRKRQIRECSNQVVEYDLLQKTIEVVKAKGVSIGARKNHTAVVYKTSMVVWGGQTENGMIAQDMLVYHMDTKEWVKILIK